MNRERLAQILSLHQIVPEKTTVLHEQCLCGKRWMVGPLAFEFHQAKVIEEAGFDEAARAQALRDAADALENQPPKLLSQYVATLRLYADAPWRLQRSPNKPTMTDVLVAHQRQSSSACLCGWSKLGESHPAHQTEMLAAAGFGEEK